MMKQTDGFIVLIPSPDSIQVSVTSQRIGA